MNSPNVPSPPKERPLPKDSADDIWLYPRRDCSEFIQIDGYVGRRLAIQAGLHGQTLRDWLIQVLKVSLDHEEAKGLDEPVIHHGYCLQLNIDDDLQEQLTRVFSSQEGCFSPFDTLDCFLSYVASAANVRIAQRLRGEAPDTVAACLIAESDRLMEGPTSWESYWQERERVGKALDQAIEAGDFDTELRIAGTPRQ